MTDFLRQQDERIALQLKHEAALDGWSAAAAMHAETASKLDEAIRLLRRLSNAPSSAGRFLVQQDINTFLKEF